MRRIFLLAAFVVVCMLQAQNLRTYKGEMLGETGTGNFSYTYYEDPDGNEIRQGDFKYTEYSSYDGGTYSAVFTGKYKAGYKDGIWNHVIEKKDYPNVAGGYTTSTLKFSTSYKDGMPHGTWSYSFTGKARRKVYSRNGWQWSAYETITPEVIRVNFKEGRLTGPLSMKAPFYNISGQLDENGFWTDTWLLDGQADECVFSNGVLKKRVVREKSGQIAFNTKYDEELLALQEQFITLPAEKQQEFLFSNRLKVDTVQGIKFYNLNDGYFDNRIFKQRETGGDKTSVSNEHGNLYDKKDYGRFIVIERVEAVPLDKLISQHGGNISHRTPEEMEDFLEMHKIKLSEEDIDRFKEMIEVRRQEVKAEQEEREFEKYYTALYGELKELTGFQKPYCEGNISGMQTMRNIDDVIFKLNSRISDFKPEIRYFSGPYALTDFSSSGYRPDGTSSRRADNKESYEKLNEYMDFVKSRLHEKDSILQLVCFPAEIKVNAYKVEYAYVTNIQQMGTGGWTTFHPKKVKKSKLYTPYISVLSYWIDTINKQETFSGFYNSLSDINALCLFMLEHVKAKTGNIEKELNATEKVEEQAEIFKKYIKK
ncbi:MAG: hypothetical protein LUG18_07290 [Candidatus Azobacteroides sp.]|nr:hypothetical protein [Candidatus Azobacteroides sp.]